jgi:hypothetical protein
VEKALVELLQEDTGQTLLELERALYPQFPGLLTPSKGLVAAVLESYAVQESGRWRLRPEDRPANRHADLREMKELIGRIGERLGYTTSSLDERTMAWMDGDEQARVFHLLASALVARVIQGAQHPVNQGILVVPGGRAGLLAYKGNRNFELQQRLEAWHVLKFRLVRTLAEIPVLNRQTFEEQITSDPVEQMQGQLMMF